MKTLLLIVVLGWVGVGLAALIQETRSSNRKLLDLKFRKWAWVLFRSLFYGPFARSRVLARL